MERTEAGDGHDRFIELCALAQPGLLSIREQRDLDRHLETCDSCRKYYKEYRVIGDEGMAFLSADEDLSEEALKWDNREAGERLLAALGRQQSQRVLSIEVGKPRRAKALLFSNPRMRLAIASLAACAVIALTLGAYRMGVQKSAETHQLATVQPQREQSREPEKQAPADLSAAQTAQMSSLQQQISNKDQEIATLRAASIVAEEHANQLGALNGQRESELHQLLLDRDQLANELAASEKAYAVLQADYSTLRADHNRYLLHTASLESELTDLRSTSRDQERRLKEDEQYLASDRDIRELMGARKLYIADVFDVDSVSRTRSAFGRVFYTQNKSLVFYAFDLDHQPGAKNASVFQVWGQRDAETKSAQHPMNLGILYMDSESNRRWVLRSDDPKQLAEIDAVFVTVEPHGGSKKPTGKPLLYALLRKEANHP
jgi:anti-sigma-K factor RskA